MKMYELLELPKLYESIKDTKMSLKTTYKFAKLIKRAEDELTWYQAEFQKIIRDYGVQENGQYKLTSDGQSIAIIPGKEMECNSKITELRNFDVIIDNIKFSIEELEGIDLSISELTCLLSLIED